jgi:pilus assembly protein Flp/PilA
MLTYLRKSLNRARMDAADKGASAVEYGLMVAAIAALIVGVVFGLGGLVGSAFNKTCTTMANQKQADGTTLGDPATCDVPGK